MYAMVLEKIGQPLKKMIISDPVPGIGEILIKVNACGICRTDLHVCDGDLDIPKLPLIPGHQIVGHIVKLGKDVNTFSLQDRVGVPWLGYSCRQCDYCLAGYENLCDDARYTGYQINGGFAEYCVANAQYCFPIPVGYSDTQAAPLLCAGIIGFRAYRKLENVKRIGIYGFGAAAHILVQVAKFKNQEIYAFTRPGDTAASEFAIKLGATWAGPSDRIAPVLLDGAIIFAPIGELIPQALRSVRKGGVVVCAGIHMSDIPSFPYSILWGERTICSIANLTHNDGEAFLSLASKIPIQTTVKTFQLFEANEALEALRYGRFQGAAVIVPTYTSAFGTALLR